MDKMKKVAIILVLFPFLMVSCVTPKPKLTKRYAEASFEPKEYWDKKQDVGATVLAVDIPGQKKDKTSVLDLSDRGQSEYIKSIFAMDNKEKSPEEIVFQTYSKKTKSQLIDRSRVNISKRLIFSLQKKYFRPADRIKEAIAKLTLDNGLEFVGWEHFENRHKMVNPGSLTLEQTNSTSFGASVSVPQVKELGEISLSQDLSRALSEVANLDREIVQFWALLNSGSATFFQSGGPSIDLSGTFIVDVSLAFQKINIDMKNTVIFKDLFDKKKVAQTASKVGYDQITVYYPRQASDIKAKLEADYILRKVTNGDKTFTESDDSVTFLKQSTGSIESILLPKNDLKFRVWTIKYDIGGKKKVLNWEKKGKTKTYEQIYFPTYSAAKTFLLWLNRVTNKPEKINHRAIGFVNFPGYKKDFTTLNNIALDFSKLKIDRREFN
jgi:hypothetical protein